MSGKTVLLVDDSKVARMMTRKVIESHLTDWTVIEASSGEEGLERLADFLAIKGQQDRETRVICEARGAREDAELELEFRRVCDGANRGRKNYPFSILIADKKTNSEGLQLADLTARPAGLAVLRPNQPNRELKSKLVYGRSRR